MKIVYRAANIIDANLFKGTLEQSGIPAFVSGEYLTGGIGELPVGGLVNVMVADIDVARAGPVVETLDAALRDGPDAAMPADGWATRLA